MKITTLLTIFIALTISLTAKSQIDKESNFYNEVKSKGINKDLAKDYGVKTELDSNVSGKLQNAIDEVAEKGGGTITIPKGTYALNSIHLKSNVHLVIDKDVVLSLKQEIKNHAIFVLGQEDQPTVHNVSIVCSDNKKKFIIDFQNSGNEAIAVSLGNVENFLISGFEVKDNYTKFSSFTFGIDKYKDEYNFPTNGIIKNCSTLNSHYGYGLIQSQASRNILFKDLSGVGGVTLRLETGAKEVNNLQIGGNHKSVARNIQCKNGNAVIMVSPHALRNGTVDIDGVLGESCGFALRIENGYIATKYTKNDSMKAGSYEDVTARNIKAIYGVDAQLKSKHFKYMPCELRSQIKDCPEIMNRQLVGTVPISVGPSIGAVLTTDEYPAFISNIETVGFKNKSIMKEKDASNCDEIPKEIVKKEKPAQPKK